ncbi:MAG TPA: phosphate signaling complex protein PhoU [Verrucomicrobiota bacterium]|nr:phosphate signaling complex protein PhoU [Verrucomicrobiota bacterium]HNU49407.1 phosphate signaling complex protein PhoU [Verrucomicrobiota bacterium]
MHPHLEESLQRGIDQIRERIGHMSARVNQALGLCWQALERRSRALAYTVILRDRCVDRIEKELDQLCLEFLVRQQPVARQLRFVYGAIRINLELERIGDYSESIARQVLKTLALPQVPALDQFQQISALAVRMLEEAVQSYLQQDADRARAAMASEEEADRLRDRLGRELLEAERSGRLPLEALTPLLTIARRFERVTDQAKNICEEVLYLCSGQYSRHRGSALARVLLVDRGHGWLSRLAESVGARLGGAGVQFTSAGLTAGPEDPRLGPFLAGRGLQSGATQFRVVGGIPDLAQWPVVVALDLESRAVFDGLPAKTVALDWSALAPGGPIEDAAFPAAAAAAEQALTERLTRLIKVLAGEAVLED